MTTTMRLRIVTPDGTLVDDTVRSVRFTGADGEYGVLPRHAAMITALEPGVLHVEHGNGRREQLLVTEGFAEVLDNTVSIIAEAGERVAEIDVARARAAEQRARGVLEGRVREHGINVDAAESALRRALARQLAAQRYGSSLDL